MEIFAGLSVGVLMLAAGVVAGKTLLLWRRTRGTPELLLGLYITCATLLGYPLAIAMTLVPASEGWPVHVAAQVVLSLGFTFLLLFTRRVFRPDAAWAAGLVGLALLGIVAATLTYVIEVTGANPRPPGELVEMVAANCFPAAVAYFWTTFESLGYHRRMKLRMRLGLAEPVVVDRFLLWGIMTLAAGFALVVNIGALFAGSFMSAPVVLVSSAMGMVHAVCLFLAFHPPDWYESWVVRRAAAEVG